MSLLRKDRWQNIEHLDLLEGGKNYFSTLEESLSKAQKSIQNLQKLIQDYFLTFIVEKNIEIALYLPQEISREIFFRVASLVRKSFKMDIVDILSDRKTAQPLLKKIQMFWFIGPLDSVCSKWAIVGQEFV
jgi:hypothetical protein